MDKNDTKLLLDKKQISIDNENRLMNLNMHTICLNLNKHCLCQLPKNSMLSKVFTVSNISSWSQERLLNLLITARLTCDIALKQLFGGTICTSIEYLNNSLFDNNTGIVDEIISLLMHTDSSISYAASNALTAIFMYSQNKLKIIWMEKLTNLFHHQSPETLCSVISIYKRILCWTDLHINDPERNIIMPVNCVSRKLNFENRLTENKYEFEINLVKTKVIEVLQTRWKMIVFKFVRYMSSFDHYNDTNNEPSNYKMGHLVIIEFIKLWISIISIKTNLNFENIKYFYKDVVKLLILLIRSKVHPAVWKNIIELFNESLCYTTTLAVQSTMEEEPCLLARKLIKVVKTKNLLNKIPFQKSPEKFGGQIDTGDKKLLQDTVLLIFKAVAIITKESRNESSSDFSPIESDNSEEINAEMAIIENTVYEVLHKLDIYVKLCMHYLPETPIAEWIIILFSDRKNILIDSMICTIDTSMVLCYRHDSLLVLRQLLNPTVSLVQFFQVLSYTSNIDKLILDLLLGNETSFLLYIMRILKFISNQWSEFCTFCGSRLKNTMNILISLHTKLETLIINDLTPYNLNPVLRLLVKCKELYTGVEIKNI